MSPEMECLIVSRHAKEATAHCTKGFACLNATACARFEVEQCLGQDGREVLFVACSHDESCSYKLAFGFSSCVCTCPVRKELYQRYSI